jgi:hypothetical protein
MPSCYSLTEAEALALDRWVRDGGVLLCEAHLGGYNSTSGRHARVLPGCGLADLWGIREVDSTSSYHLKISKEHQSKLDLSGDVGKAADAYGTSNGKFFPILLSDGTVVHGAERFAELSVEGGEILGVFGDKPCIVRQRVGSGTVIYCGANLGQGSEADFQGLRKLVIQTCELAGIRQVMEYEESAHQNVHVDLLYSGSDLTALVIYNRADSPQRIRLKREGRYRGTFTSRTIELGDWIEIPGGMVDLFVESSQAIGDARP